MRSRTCGWRACISPAPPDFRQAARCSSRRCSTAWRSTAARSIRAARACSTAARAARAPPCAQRCGSPRTAGSRLPSARLSGRRRRSICGALQLDRAYLVGLSACIIDAGAGVAHTAPALAIGAASGDPEAQWGAPIALRGITVLGRTRVERARGEGGIFVHRLEVHDNQDSHTGPLFSVRSEADESDILALFARPGSCIKASYFSGRGDRLAQHFACVFGTEALLRFGAEIFGAPAYAQLALSSDRRVREEGPGADEMGAFGFLRNAHKWRNIGIRLREFMPAGVRALLVAVT
jgi:hypothetical protein